MQHIYLHTTDSDLLFFPDDGKLTSAGGREFSRLSSGSLTMCFPVVRPNPILRMGLDGDQNVAANINPSELLGSVNWTASPHGSPSGWSRRNTEQEDRRGRFFVPFPDAKSIRCEKKKKKKTFRQMIECFSTVLLGLIAFIDPEASIWMVICPLKSNGSAVAGSEGCKVRYYYII